MVQQVIARSDGGEHLAHGRRGGVAVARPCRSGAHHPLRNFLVHSVESQFRANFLISSTAERTTASGTSLVISTLPISRGNTKCTIPCLVFLSERRRFRIFGAFQFIRGSLPKPITAFVMRPAVTLSSFPVEREIWVAA